MHASARLITAIASASLACLLLGSPVSAHALHVASVPPAGADIPVAPDRVVVTFGEAPDPALSRLDVVASDGHTVTAGPTVVVPGQTTQLQVPLQPVPNGLYTVAWRAVSAVDGHLSAGSFVFGVNTLVPVTQAGASSAGTSGVLASVDPISVLGRWVLFIGLSGLLGAAAIALIVTRRPSRATLPLAWGGWIIAVIGTVAVLASEMTDAEVGLDRVMSTSLGTQVVERGVPLILVAAALLLATWKQPPRRAVLVGVAAAVVLAMLADVLASHAAASGSTTSGIVVQWLHFVAAGAWLGGLAALLVSLAGAQPDAGTRVTVRRFAWIAAVGLVVVAATGVLRAIAEVGTVDALVSTDFGRLIIAKSGLLALLAALGAVNHFGNAPRADTQLSGLRRVGSTEVSFALVVLFLAATLVNLPPPSAVAVSTATPDQRVDIQTTPGLPTIYTVHLTAGGTLQVYADPGASGPNELHATFFDAAGAEVPVTTATLRVDPAAERSASPDTWLRPRMLEPGHFVADMDLVGGDHSLVVTGIASDGSYLAARIDLTIDP